MDKRCCGYKRRMEALTRSTRHLETMVKRVYACSDEQKDLSLAETLRRLLSLALAKAREAGIIAEGAVLALIDAVMPFAIDMLHTGK